MFKCKFKICKFKIKYILFLYEKYIRESNTYWAGHTQVIRTNQHGEHFQAEVTRLSRTAEKTRSCHFIPKKMLSFYS